MSPLMISGGWTVQWEDLPMTDVFLLWHILLWHISHALRASVSSTSTMTDALCPTSTLVMRRNFWASAPAMPLPRPESSLPGRCPDSATEPDCFQITLYRLDKDEWTEGFFIVECGGAQSCHPDSDQRSATPVPSAADGQGRRSR
jgi:hypothetical protein